MPGVEPREMPPQRPILIAGGGPVGVIAALALARQRQRRDDADRAAAGYEDGTLGRHFPAFYAGPSVAAIRGGGWSVGQYPLNREGRRIQSGL